MQEELKTLKRLLYHIKLIKLARKALENRLNNEKNYVSEDDYNVFVISAFMLVKENLIKKDSLNDILYFDYNNEDYIPYILKLANKINGNDYQTNNTTVTIQNTKEDLPQLKDAIWIVNKIRDSLAHGAYEIKDDKIIIDNNHMNENVPYKLTCTLDINDLAEFVLSTVTKTKIDKTKIFKYLSPLLRKKEQNEKLNIVTRGHSTHILVVDPKKAMKKTPYMKDRIYTSITPKENSYKIVLENLRRLKEEIKKNPRMLSHLKYNVDTANNMIEDANTEEKYAIKSTDIINSITSYFGQSAINDVIDRIYLYNYMSLVFTLNSDETLEVPNLDLTNIDFSLTDDDYHNLKASTIDLVHKSVRRIKRAKENYDEHKDVVPYHTVTNVIDSFHQKITDKANSINNIITRLIRNGLEHANFTTQDDKIKIFDKANQNSNDEKGIFIGSVYDFYKLTKYIEKQKLDKDSKLLDITLLEKHLPNSEYTDLIDTLFNCEIRNKVKTK